MLLVSPVPVPILELLVECFEFAVGCRQLTEQLLIVALRLCQILHTFAFGGEIIADLF